MRKRKAGLQMPAHKLAIIGDNRNQDFVTRGAAMTEPPSYDTEQRFLLSVVSICVLVLLAAPTLAIMFASESWSYKVARLTAYPRLVAFGFMAAWCLIAPLMFCLKSIFFMRLACLGAAMGAFASLGMAYLSRDIDLGFEVWKFQNAYSFYYTLVGAACLIFAAAIAVLLNSRMLYELRKEKQDAKHA